LGYIGRFGDDRDIFMVGTCFLAPVLGASNNSLRIDNTEFVMHQWFVSAAWRNEEDLTAKIGEFSEVNPTRALIDIVPDEVLRDLFGTLVSFAI
jgi:hypothetical protein